MSCRFATQTETDVGRAGKLALPALFRTARLRRLVPTHLSDFSPEPRNKLLPKSLGQVERRKTRHPQQKGESHAGRKSQTQTFGGSCQTAMVCPPPRDPVFSPIPRRAGRLITSQPMVLPSFFIICTFREIWRSSYVWNWSQHESGSSGTLVFVDDISAHRRATDGMLPRPSGMGRLVELVGGWLAWPIAMAIARLDDGASLRGRPAGRGVLDSDGRLERRLSGLLLFPAKRRSAAGRPWASVSCCWSWVVS